MDKIPHKKTDILKDEMLSSMQWKTPAGATLASKAAGAAFKLPHADYTRLHCAQDEKFRTHIRHWDKPQGQNGQTCILTSLVYSLKGQGD